jgi:N-acetylmuramic acid 6-phosphate etherase
MSDLPPTEAADPRYESLSEWPDDSALAALWEAQAASVAAVRAALPAIGAAARAALPGLASGGRLVYAGAGTSGRLAAQDAAELPPTFGWEPERAPAILAGGEAAFRRAVEGAEDDRAAARAALAPLGLGHADTLIAVAASGATPFTLAAAEAAREAGATTIGIVNAGAGCPLARAVAWPIVIETGPEPIAGSTRLKAGTAQKVALNLLSTLLMLRLGRSRGGRMTAMRAANAKLRARGTRLLMSLASCDEAEAAAALEAAHGDVERALAGLRQAAGMKKGGARPPFP